MNGCSENFDLKKRLVDKSIEAYCLALETINRVTIQYRLESFCYLFCNAWELLLKAKIVSDQGSEQSIYYNQHQHRKRSLSLRDCLNKTFANQQDPIRRNIERIEELRDESVHLVIGRVPQDVMSLFQAGVINYHNRLNQWFGESLSDRFPVGMMSLVYDLSPEQSNLTDARLQRELGADAATFLARYCADVKKEFEEMHGGAPEFSITIEYRLVLTKRSDGADIRLTSGQKDGAPTQIVEIPKDPSTSHPYRQKELLNRVNTTLTGTKINQYDIQCVNKVHHIKNKQDFFYQGKIPGSPGQYSQAYADWLVKQFDRDDQFFEKARVTYKHSSEKAVHAEGSSYSQ